MKEKEVSEFVFWYRIKDLNVHPKILGRYPYVSSFRTPDGVEQGRMEPKTPEGGGAVQYRYLIKER